MKRFTSICMDNISGMRLIYEDCSYNMAVSQLVKDLFNVNPFDESKQPRVKIQNASARFTIITFLDIGRTFVYDEERGVVVENDPEEIDNAKKDKFCEMYGLIEYLKQEKYHEKD